MFEVWQQPIQARAGLGAVLDVNVSTYDASEAPKSAFAPGEQIYFVARGEPNTGVLVEWSRDGIQQQSLGWQGVNTDAQGTARWRATAGPSGIGSGTFTYRVVIPVIGYGPPDPSKTITFTVGGAQQSTSTTTPTTTPTPTGGGRVVETTERTVTQRTPQCIAPAYYDALLGVCVTPGAYTNTTNTATNVQTQTQTGANACTPFGLVMNESGQCIIPRTTTERYPDDYEYTERQKVGLLEVEIKKLQDQLKQAANYQYTVDSSAITAKLNAALAELEALKTGGGGNLVDGGGFELPSYLQGDWFGLPKPLVIIGGFFVVMALKK